jgi:hypothetical protein
MTGHPDPMRRGLLLSAAASALAARSRSAARPAAPAEALSAASFGAVGDGKTDDTAALQRALDAAARQGGLLVIPPGTYRVTQTLRFTAERAATGDIGHRNGILARGARLLSAVTGGRNVVEVVSRATVRFTLLEGLEVLGNGGEGHGIFIECDRKDDYFYNFCMRDAIVQRCGGDGCRMVGNVFEGQIIDSCFRNNGGAGGILSSLHVFASVFGENDGAGAELLNQCYDVAFHGCYFVLNGRAGLSAQNGCTLLSNCGFENNHAQAANCEAGGAGVELGSFGTLVGCTGYSVFHQTRLIRAFVTGQLVSAAPAAGTGRPRAPVLRSFRARPRARRLWSDAPAASTIPVDSSLS